MLINIYDFRILGILILVWIVLTFVKSGFIPDYLNLESTISSGVYIQIMISFLSVFGFLITILLLVYSILKEKFRRQTLKEFFSDSYSKLLITGFLGIFLIDVFSSIYINAVPFSGAVLNVSYYSLILSIAFLVVFIPLSLTAISKSESQCHIAKYIYEFKLEHFPENRSNLGIDYDENNPIVIIINLSKAYFNSEDLHSVNATIFSSQQKIESLINSSNKDREVIGRLLSGQVLIWEPIIQKALQNKEHGVINNIFLAISGYHHFFSKQNIPLLYLEKISHYVNGLVEKLAAEGVQELLEYIMITFEKILEFHYANSVPCEENIHDIKTLLNKSDKKSSDFKPRSTHELDYFDLQWNKILSDIPFLYAIILRVSIEKQNLALFRSAISSVAHLAREIHRSNLSENQKMFLLRVMLGKLYVYQIDALKSGLIKESSEVTHMDSFTITNSIDQEFSYTKEFLESESEFLLSLLKLDIIGYDDINFWGSIGRSCVWKNNKTFMKQTFDYVLRVFKHLKKTFEKELSSHIDQYEMLIDQVESFEKFHRIGDINITGNSESTTNKKVDEEIINKIKDFKGKFKKVKYQKPPFKIKWV